MDLESLRIFEAVATEQSITRAAAQLGRAPSNVTTRIQQLEAELTVELFQRQGKRIVLSAAGEQFLDYARRLLALADEARQMLTRTVAGSLRLGSMESTAAARLPQPLAMLNQQHPDIRLTLTTGPSMALLEQLRQGLLDAAFVALPQELENATELHSSGLQGQPLWDEQLLLLLPASQRDVQAADQVRSRTLAAFRSGCTYRARAEHLLNLPGDPRWQVQELGSYHAMIACVAAGDCVTLLPHSVLQLSGASTSLTSLPAGSARTWLVWRRGFATPALQRLREALSEACRSSAHA